MSTWAKNHPAAFEPLRWAWLRHAPRAHEGFKGKPPAAGQVPAGIRRLSSRHTPPRVSLGGHAPRLRSPWDFPQALLLTAVVRVLPACTRSRQNLPGPPSLAGRLVQGRQACAAGKPTVHLCARVARGLADDNHELDTREGPSAPSMCGRKATAVPLAASNLAV